MGKCRFNTNWLSQKDTNGYLLSEFIVKNVQDHNDFSVLCKVCDKIINTERGVTAILQHCKGDRHKNAFDLKIRNNQRLSVVDNTLRFFEDRGNAIKAELLWTLKCVVSNFSFNSANNLKHIFQQMFPDSSIAKSFSLSPKKLKYLITGAFEPYFKECLMEDIQGKF